MVLVGDAAHAMSPFRGEGGYNAFIDALKLSKSLIRLAGTEKAGDITAVRAAVIRYNAEMLRRGVAAVRASRDTHSEVSGNAWVLSMLGDWNPLFFIPVWVLAFLLRVLLNRNQSFAFEIKQLQERKIVLGQNQGR